MSPSLARALVDLADAQDPRGPRLGTAVLARMVLSELRRAPAAGSLRERLDLAGWALGRAAATWNPSRGIRYATHARWWLRTELGRAPEHLARAA